MDDALKQKLDNYKPNQEAIETVKSTRILLLVGPTGAGKDYLKDTLLKTGRYHHLISHTTRSPRVNHGKIEQDGREYHFISLDEAEKMLDSHAFFEAKTYSGNIYGTSIRELESAREDNKVAVTDLEVKGVEEYKTIDPSVMAVFLLPPDFETWQARLCSRYGDNINEADHRLRLETALQEIQELLNHDYYDAFINYDDISKTFEKVDAFVQTDGQESPQDREEALTVAKNLASSIQDYLKATA